MMHVSRSLALITVITALLWPVPKTGDAQSNAVDLNLVIAVDCSFSVDASEFDLQRTCLAQAFRDADVIQRIEGGQDGRIAVTVVQWSSSENQIVAIPWFVVEGGVSANVLETMPRRTSDSGTSISAMLDTGVALIASSPYRASRNVIDIQADGTNNNGGDIDPARDRAVAQGITINGLAIVNEISWLQFNFRNHIIGGTGSFVEIATSYNAYARAIRLKLLKEIAPPMMSILTPDHTNGLSPT